MSQSHFSTQLKLFGESGDDDIKQSRLLILGLAAAIILSALLLWLVSQNLLLVGGFIAAFIAAMACAYYIHTLSLNTQQIDHLPPDWAVTRTVADQSNTAVAICDRAGRMSCANERFEKWFAGLKPPPDLDVGENERAMLIAAGRTAWREGIGIIESLKHDGQDFQVKAVKASSSDEYLIWTFEPVVEQSLSTLAVEAFSGQIGQRMGEAGIMSLVVGGEGRIRSCNSAFAARATGRAEANIVSRDFATFLRSDEKGRIYFEREGRRGVPLRLMHIPLRPDDKNSPAIIFALDEDSAQMDRQNALVHVENLLADLPLGLALADRDGRFLFANNSFARVAGMPIEQLPPYPGDLVIKEDKAAVADTVRRYAAGQPMSGDIAVRLLEAPDEVVSLSIAGVRGLGDASVLIGLKDNSEESKLKRQVAQATKMQAVGQLAGGVAHDFNNILTAIIGYCDLMLLRHSPGDSDYDDIQQIKNNSNRAASLTRQLLAFSRQQTLRPQILQLPDVVSEVSALLKRLLGEKVRLEVKHGRNIGTVRADPGQLEQVIINLGVNARDAMPNGGVLTLETKSVSVADVRAMNSEILPLGDYAMLSVSDMGTGISKDNLGKIFEPFFTTKEVGKGTGLGLSTVYGIVKQSGGFIFADSVEGEGTQFNVYLPVHIGEASEDLPALSKVQDKSELWGSGRVLIVEDEDMVRAVAERALVRQGYQVETACDGEEALEILSKSRKFDLIVSDVVMPNMDGPTMARKVREIYGDVRILFMSGYAEEQLRQSIDIDNMFFLPKPFSVQQISQSVKNAMDFE